MNREDIQIYRTMCYAQVTRLDKTSHSQYPIMHSTTSLVRILTIQPMIQQNLPRKFQSEIHRPAPDMKPPQGLINHVCLSPYLFCMFTSIIDMTFSIHCLTVGNRKCYNPKRAKTKARITWTHAHTLESKNTQKRQNK